MPDSTISNNPKLIFLHSFQSIALMIIIYRHVLPKGTKLSLLTNFLGQISYTVVLKAAERIWNVLSHKFFSYPPTYTIFFCRQLVWTYYRLHKSDLDENVIVISLPVANMTRPISHSKHT